MCAKFLSPANFSAGNTLYRKAFRSFGENTGEKKLRLFRLKSESRKHGVCRGQLCAVVQMGIDICRRGKVAVSQPILNLLHRDTVCQHERGTTMSEIMEANAPQAVCIQQLRKLLRHIMRLDEVSHFVDADITGELLMV